jgi:hypothetical protein
LKGEDAQQLAVFVEHRAGNEARRGILARGVGSEVEKGFEAWARIVPGRAEGLAEIGIPPGAGQEIGGVVRLLEHAVDEVAFGIEQEDVVIAPFPPEFPEPGVIEGMGVAVGRFVVVGLQLVLLPDRVGIVGDVELVQLLGRLIQFRPAFGQPQDGVPGH